MFEYTKEQQGDVVIFSVQGSLDATSAPQLRLEFDRLLEANQVKVVFDLQDLTTIDSSGVGAIVFLFKRVRPKKGDVKICRLRNQPMEIFSLLRLDRAFDVAPTVEDAVARFK